MHALTAFLASGAPGHGEAAPGDHLQTGYRLWLAGHQLEHGQQPWVDPYSFRPEAEQANPRVVALRASVLAARPHLRAGAGVERVHAGVPVRRRRAGAALAARARALPLRGRCGRARVRDRPVPARPEPRAPARTDLAAAAARALGVRARAQDRRPALVVGLARGARLDPALRPGPPRARGDPVLRAVRDLPLARGTGRLRDRARRGGGGPRRRADRPDGDQRLDRRGRPLAEGGERLLRNRDRLRLSPRRRQRGGVRLPRLADAAPRGRRVHPARAAGPVARERAGDRRASSRSCSPSGRTTRCTARSGTPSPRFVTRASPSG